MFEVAGARPVAYVSSLEGLYPREYSQAWTWRWTDGSATLRVEHLGAEPQTATLVLELASFGVERHVIVSLNGHHVTDLIVGSDRARYPYPIGPMLLGPGRNELTIRSVEPPIVAGTIERNDDSRPLAVAVGAWRWQ